MTAVQYGFWMITFCLGAAIGSFLNVVIYRLPRGMSLIRPPSHCVSCGVRLRILDLIPILSWLWLRGRCRYCGHRISSRYMVVELVTALLACACAYLYSDLTAVPIFVVCAALVVAFFVDLDHMIIPDQVHVAIACSGVLLDVRTMLLRGMAGMVVFTEPVGAGTSTVLTMAWPRSVLGAVVAGGLFMAVGYVAQLVFRRPALGMGDVKLAAALGTVLGPGYYFISFFLFATVIGGLVGAFTLIFRRNKSHYIPFGPMLAVSGIALVLAPERMSALILSRFLL
jgi:leader peptidase (prepilin peptidase)/N-methyltransferase